MNLKELASILATMYGSAPKGYAVANIHLFGIKYANQIANFSKKEIIEESGIRKSYLTELSKGIKLAELLKNEKL